MKTSSYQYFFINGHYTISKGIKTKFDWFLTCELYNDKNGNKQIIKLDENIFLTRKAAINYIHNLLTKFKLN
jgi:hypothetical protein